MRVWIHFIACYRLYNLLQLLSIIVDIKVRSDPLFGHDSGSSGLAVGVNSRGGGTRCGIGVFKNVDSLLSLSAVLSVTLLGLLECNLLLRNLVLELGVSLLSSTGDLGGKACQNGSMGITRSAYGGCPVLVCRDLVVLAHHLLDLFLHLAVPSIHQ
jgi:hypothetical protein